MRYPPATWRISMPWADPEYSATSSSSVARMRDLISAGSIPGASAASESLTSE